MYNCLIEILLLTNCRTEANTPLKAPPTPEGGGVAARLLWGSSSDGRNRSSIEIQQLTAPNKNHPSSIQKKD